MPTPPFVFTSNPNGIFSATPKWATSTSSLGKRIIGGFLNKTDSNEYRNNPHMFLPPEVITQGVTQVHKSNILIIDQSSSNLPPTLEYDGILTNQPNLSLIIKTADCIPLLAYHQNSPWVGALHCGWRSIVGNDAGGIIQNFFRLTRGFGLSECDWVFLIGPGICGECYEVGEELIDAFSKILPVAVLSELAVESKKNSTSNEERKKYLLDLKRIAKYFLEYEGIPAENIYIDERCTLSDPRFNSHRENGTKERNINFIGMMG